MIDITKNIEIEKQLIDEYIAKESKVLLSEVSEKYGRDYANNFGAYLDVLERGGKRLRGILAKKAYEAFGGSDSEVGLRAALIVELIHDYLLVIDDIEDVAKLRRGKPTAHYLLRDYHAKNGLAGDSAHYGESQAINAALAGQNYAMLFATRLDAPEKNRLKALEWLNEFLVNTTFGQIGDFYNEASKTDSSKDALQVIRLKTAYYTLCLPVYFGSALAGADTLEENFAEGLVKAGVAFQLYDDIISTFGDSASTGKDNMGDIAEGKRTLLVIYALEKASEAQRRALEEALGNRKLTVKKFEQACSVVRETGALDRCLSELNDLVDESVKLFKSAKNTPKELTEFLQGFSEYIATRVQI